MVHKKLIIVSLILVLLLIANVAFSLRLFKSRNNDWPMWRYDASRSAASPHKLSDKLHLQWVRDYPKLEQAWENPLNRDLMQFDKVYEPVVQGKTMFIGSSASDRMVALNTETGEEKWSFYVGGPVRLPPVAYNGNVYFVSDDGYLYCVDGEQGTLIWKFQGGPSHRKILGNERMVSTWLARGGPVLVDGIVYFGAGIWPFMGTFIYALDAETGEIVWENDSTGPIYMKQPHNSPSYAGVAPQGAFVVSGDRLLVPCGRSMPACFDRRTGELLYYHLAKYNKGGGAFAAAQGDYFVNYHRDYVTSLYELPKGERIISQFGKIPVMTEKTLFSMGSSITAFDLGNLRQIEQEEKIVVDAGKKKIKVARDKKWVLDELWKAEVDASGDLIKAGRRLYAGGKNIVSAVSIPRFGKNTRVKWKANIEGTAARIIAADDRLFVVTLEGRIYAFGEKKVTPKLYPYTVEKSPVPKDVLAEANYILKSTEVKEGYCLAYGLENGDLVKALTKNSELRIIAVDPDPEKVDHLRRRLDAEGLYGKRLSVHVGDPFTFEAPPYLASLTVFEDLDAAGYRRGDDFFSKIYESMRPYGGIACLPVNSSELPAIVQQVRDIDLPKAKVRGLKRATRSLQGQGHVFLTRTGSLPGADGWTHQYGDIANTAKSDDQLVKLPLGVLWFGGSSNMDVLPRHGHGPPEQVVGGRLFIQGIGSFSARDVYTGRVLWKRSLEKLDTFGVYYNETYADTPLNPAYNQRHIPGANARGTNFVATLDKLYIARKGGCLILDTATGKTVDEFKLPEDPRTGLPAEWGYIGVYKDYLIAGAGFVHYLDFLDLDELGSGITSKYMPFYNFDITSSKKLVVMNRHTGEILWTRDSKLGFRHNAIVVGDDKLFCIDTVPIPVSDALKRRLGEYHLGESELIAMNVNTGRTIWSTTEGVFGTWLGYSEERGILIQSGRKSRDMLRGEPAKGLTAYRGRNGKVLWSNSVSRGGPYILHNDTIITDRYAYSLLTGEQKTRINPVIGAEGPWKYQRNYGCNYATASEHLLTFRSAAAGFFDLTNDGGTGNFGGFRSSCSSNLVAADGVLNAPDYTRTCSCNYQNQTSLALIHMPEVEMWTDNFYEPDSNAIAASKSAIAIFDAEGNLTCANDSFLKLFGYDDHSEVLGQSVSKFIETGEPAQKALATLLGKGEWSGELVAIKKDGATLDVYLSVELGIDAVGIPVSIMALFVDIDASALAFFDLDGNLTYANDVFLSLLEYSDKSEVLGRQIADFWEKEDAVLKVLKAVRTEKTWKGDMVALKEDGSTVDTYLSASMASDELGSPTFIITSFVDLTERQKAIEIVTRVDTALSATCSIEQFIADNKIVRSVGINFGAPGDRKADDGVLWLEYPVVGGPSPRVKVKIGDSEPLFRTFDMGFQTDLDKNTVPAKLRREFSKEGISLLPYPTVSVEKKGSEWLITGSRKRTYIVKKSGYWLDVYGYEQFSHHSSRIQGDGLKWVAASGVKGLSSLGISLASNPVDDTSDGDDGGFAETFIDKRLYTVRLHFSEPEDINPGQRKFDVAIQGEESLKGFDIVKEAGGQNRPVVKEFKGIPVTWDLLVTLTPSDDTTHDPLICGIEVVSEGW